MRRFIFLCLLAYNLSTFAQTAEGGGAFLNGGKLINSIIINNYAVNGFGVSGSSGEVTNCNIRDNYYLNSSIVKAGDLVFDDGSVYTPVYDSFGNLIFPLEYGANNVIGVCFWSNANNYFRSGYYWVVSVQEALMSWAPGVPYNPIDVIGLYDFNDPATVILDFNGFENSKLIVNDVKHSSILTTSNCAAKYCLNYSQGGTLVTWFLPAMGQLREMEKELGTLNSLMTKLGKTKLAGRYWSSDEIAWNDKNGAWTYNFPQSSQASGVNKKDILKVRPIALVYKTN